jgi:GNAT superfamily N-acetyltransferase
MNLITDLETLEVLWQKHFVKNTITNNYLLPNAYKELITTKKLSFIQGRNNIYLLVEKNGFYRLFYFINNFNEILNLDADKPVVMEILYRGESRKPNDIFNFWKKSGFKQHLTRDNLVASYKQLSVPDEKFAGIKWKFVSTEPEIAFTKELLDNSLDKYTGDELSLEEVSGFADKKNIICVYWENKLAGALQFEIKNNVIWLGHIAVSHEFRGKGIAKELVKVFIDINKVTTSTRYQLWVIQDNLSAVRLYNKFGFIYGNKSSASMLKM